MHRFAFFLPFVHLVAVSPAVMSSPFPSPILLDIGGKKFSTTIDTLTQREPDSMLAAMFSGRHTVCLDSQKGFIFVDRDGKHFRHILNWLRDGVVPTLADSEYSELLREAEYYQLLGLVEQINTVIINRRKDDEEPKAELTRIDIIKCIQSERVRFRGVNLSDLDMSKLDLSLVDFSHACLRNASFSSANLQSAKFRVVEAGGSNFYNAVLRVSLLGQIFVELYLLELIFRVQIYKTADLTDANLEGANLEGANLKGAKLTRANLQKANLQRAYLRHVDLRDTTFQCLLCLTILWVSNCILWKMIDFVGHCVDWSCPKDNMVKVQPSAIGWC
ncbi:FH protein interacting protein FIP2 isoform X4 [Magnolia sinica]|uniref:FH protein interacting protein FIP2 isoform X4 n=1 Tax=Magnolia sinica TaxID=86752 RepID=UPI002658875D|nr:FH protein interacting protein FIP2 isoform X4 [Magnolia sinica]